MARENEVVKELRIKYSERGELLQGTVRLFLYKTSDNCGIFYGFIEENKLKDFNMISQSLGIVEAYTPEMKRSKQDAEKSFLGRVDRYLEAMGASKADIVADITF